MELLVLPALEPAAVLEDDREGLEREADAPEERDPQPVLADRPEQGAILVERAAKIIRDISVAFSAPRSQCPTSRAMPSADLMAMLPV